MVTGENSTLKTYLERSPKEKVTECINFFYNYKSWRLQKNKNRIQHLEYHM